MASNNQNLTVTARAVDQASGPLRGLAGEIAKFPQTASKATSALAALEAANSDLGITVGRTISQAASLAGMIGRSGPLGIAIAGASALVAAGTHVWSIYKEQITAVENASKSLSAVIAKQSSGADALRADVANLDARLAAFGKTADEAAIAQARLDFQTKSEGAKNLAVEITKAESASRSLTQALRERSFVQSQLAGTAEGYKNLNVIRSIEEEIRLNKLSLDGLRASKVAIDSQVVAESQRIDRLRQLIAKQTEAKTAQEATAAATRNAAAAAREHSQALKSAIDRVLEQTEAEKKRFAELLVNIDSGSKQRIGAINLEVEAQEKRAILLDQQEQKSIEEAERSQEKRRAQYQATAGILVNSFGDAFGSMINGSKSADKAFSDLFKNLGKMVLAQAATYLVAKGIETAANISAGETKVAVDTSTAASGALSAHSNIPFVGIAIGLAAAAAIITAILAFKKFSKGGVVTGGEQGRDSVPALLEPGEVVLPVGVVQSISRIMGRSPAGRSSSLPGGIAMASGGVVPSGGGSRSSTTINISNQMLDASPDQLKAFGKRIGKVLADLQRNGHINLAPVT